MHWAFKYIGLPYKIGADGTHSYDCWGLARSIFAERLGIDMPQVAIRENNNAPAMRKIADVFGWGPVQDAPKECDALIMRSAFGRHIAVAIDSGKGVKFIHADDRCGVEIISRIDDFARMGYTGIEVWRYDARTRN